MIERNTIDAIFRFCPLCDSKKLDFDTGFEPVKREDYW